MFFLAHWVIVPDDHKCVISGYLDIDKETDERHGPRAVLHCAHILKRAVGTRAAKTVSTNDHLFDSF
jgi:hypothetical protein